MLTQINIILHQDVKSNQSNIMLYQSNISKAQKSDNFDLEKCKILLAGKAGSIYSTANSAAPQGEDAEKEMERSNKDKRYE